MEPSNAIASYPTTNATGKSPFSNLYNSLGSKDTRQTGSLKKFTIGLAIRGEILVGRACARTSTFTWLKTNWKPCLFEYKSKSTYESNNIDWVLLNVDTFFSKIEQSRDTLTTHKTYM